MKNMGYCSMIEPNGLKFQSDRKFEEYKELPQEEKEIGMNPFFENMITDAGFTNEIYFMENYVKMQDYKIWIPFFAKFFKGIIYVDGDESSDHWRIEFHGDETFDVYDGQIEYTKVAWEDFE
jgi:hypothetical protein